MASGPELRALRQELNDSIRRGRDARALELYGQLERADPAEARWPHRHGDLLHRLGRDGEAVRSYERAVDIYAKAGFVARAAAMAKVILGIDAERVDILERVDPEAARRLHRHSRDTYQSAADDDDDRPSLREAPPLTPADDQEEDEIRFVDVDDLDEASIELDMSDLEIVEDPAPKPSPRVSPEEIDEANRTAAQLAALPSTPLFAEVPRVALSLMLVESTLHDLEDGEVLIRRGDPADSLFVLVDGSCEVHVPARGAPIVLEEGDVVGESCLLDGVDRRADVLVRGRALALEIPKPVIDEMVSQNPRMGDLMLELLCRRLISNLVLTHPIFSAFDRAQRFDLARLFEVRRAAPGQVLLARGKRSDGLYIPLAGRTLVEGADGRSAILSRGRIFGQRSLLSREASEVTVRCDTQSIILRMPAARFTELAATFPTVLAHLSELSAGEIDDLGAEHVS